jgi:hypothetical protein
MIFFPVGLGHARHFHHGFFAMPQTTLQAVRLGQVWTGKASQPAFLGGD